MKNVSTGLALKDFIDYANFLEHTSRSFSGGGNYKRFIGDSFAQATQKFVSSLASFEYDIDYSIFYERRHRVKAIFTRIINKAFKLIKSRFRLPEDKLYFVNVSPQRFIELAQTYMDDIFTPVAESNNAECIVLKQAVSPFYPEGVDFFRNAKLVIVDRDPRDIYSTQILINAGFGRDWAKYREAWRYIDVHKAYRFNREQLKNNSNVLMLRLEDLIYRYEDSLACIMDFTGLKPENHIHKREFFNPDVSAKNVGLWRKIISSTEADEIAQALPEYCYNA